MFIKRLDYLIFLLHIPKANWTCDLITDYRKSLKLVTFIFTDSRKSLVRAFLLLRLATMAMSQQSLPPVSQYTGSYTEDVDGDGVRLNAFGHEDASIAYDPLSANRRFAGAADLAVLGDPRVRRCNSSLYFGDGSRLLAAAGK